MSDTESVISDLCNKEWAREIEWVDETVPAYNLFDIFLSYIKNPTEREKEAISIMVELWHKLLLHNAKLTRQFKFDVKHRSKRKIQVAPMPVGDYRKMLCELHCAFVGSSHPGKRSGKLISTLSKIWFEIHQLNDNVLNRKLKFTCSMAPLGCEYRLLRGKFVSRRL